MKSENMIPQNILTAPDTIRQMETACRKQFRVSRLSYDAEECFFCVLDGLERDSCSRIRAYAGRSSFKTYLRTVIHTLSIDCFRKKYGRIRPPAAIQKMGEPAMKIWNLHCIRQYSYEDIYEILCIQGDFAGTFREYENLVQTVRAVPCPESFPEMNCPEQNREGENREFCDPEQENALEELIRKVDENRRLEACRIIREKTEELSEADRLLIRMVYDSERPVSEASKVLGISPAATRKRLKRILLFYREKLLACGIREG